VKTVETVDIVSLMNRIPTNEFALSSEGGWDKFTMPKVQRWVNENFLGKRVRFEVCKVSCNVSQEDASTKPDEWTVQIQVGGIHADCVGMANRILPVDKDDETGDSPFTMSGVAVTWNLASYAFKCNETEARKWDTLSKKPAQAVVVQGDIVGINFQPHRGGVLNGHFVGYDTFVKLDNAVVTPSNETEPGALFISEMMLAMGGQPREPEASVTELKRLDTSGDFQLIFMKYIKWDSPLKDEVGTTTNLENRVTTQLIAFSMADEAFHRYQDFEGLKLTPCDDPPTESQLVQAKAAVGWPEAKK
jgi:hypothetical protein